ncbi:hypothetical protein RHS01_09317 [Rhizoctonia solani]|uniref:Reverse transcriptase n=1 Tax=Rhizoctonia solani TaxID=456999 RepID=A0A8H7I3W2_9AGAM|nr:hypothetical protein RHS01_09317 [Rhizoctonia solani]
MATRSRPPSQARSLLIRRVGTFLPPASPELGKVSLEQVIRLLWDFSPKLTALSGPLWNNQCCQGWACPAPALPGSPHPRRTKTPAVEETPRAAPKVEPIGKTQPFLGAPAPILPTGAPRRNPSQSSTPIHPPPSLWDRLQPPRDLHLRLSSPRSSLQPLHGKGGSSRRLQRQNRLGSQTMADTNVGLGTPEPKAIPLDVEVLSFLLMNMTEAGGAWAHPHLDQLGSHCALIQTMDEFKVEFLAALAIQTQPGQQSGKLLPSPRLALVPNISLSSARCKWNLTGMTLHFAANLRVDFTGRELQDAALIIDNALRKERASHPQQGNKSGKSSATPTRGQVPANRPPKLVPLLQSQLQKQAEDIEVLIDSGATSSFLHPRTAKALRLPLIDLPQPHTVTMLDGLSPQAGKIWKKANLTFLLDGKRMTETFLICNTGSHAAILGIKWLETHNPEINWNTQTLSFPHTVPEHVTIAKEEEADKNPLEGVPSKYHQYSKVFGEEEFNKLPPHRHYNIGIELTEEGPLNSPLYSMTNAKSATLKDWLRDELKAGKIRPSKSLISSPVMFVPKKDGSRCLVVDYCRLINWTKKNVYPLPHPDDLMAQLCGAKIFTKLDLQWGYNNVQVKEGDKWKTAFHTKYSLYESLVMTFGLTNAPASFQHFMNNLFKDLLDVCVIIYLNDILIYSKDNASHAQHVHKVLKRLMDNQLFCKALKCTFHVTLVEYLGIIVLDKGFSLDKLKIQAVQEWPTPTKLKEVQSFLGFANFLRRFVANFSHMTRPLHNLVKKDTPWKWDAKEQEAFQGLKDAITNAPVLCHADPTKPYFLETDALGAALGTAHPVTVFTNHRNLEYWKESQTFNRCHARWHLLLAGYNFQIIYRPGKQLGKPDALSRRLDHADILPAAQTMLPDSIFANVALITPEKELQRQIKLSLDQDKSLEEILQFQQNNSKAPPSIKCAFRDYKMEAGLLFYQGRIVVPDVDSLRTDLLRIFHDSPLAGHPGRQQTLELVLRNYYWPGIQSDTPWQHVSYDMIVDLPKDRSNDSILVIVDSFTKYGIFVKCSKKLKAPKLAELFLEHVWKRHGMPEKTISDRGRVFNNKFLQALYKRLGIDPHFSLAYHPQSNRQTEQVNPSIEHFLRAYSGVNQWDWTKWLPMAEFAYNNAVHSSTGKTPFKALYRWEPSLTPSNIPTNIPEADDLAKAMEAQWKEVESTLRQSKQRMIARESGAPVEFEVGEEAWLDAKNVNLKTLSPKLTEQRLGPFKVIKKSPTVLTGLNCLQLCVSTTSST